MTILKSKILSLTFLVSISFSQAHEKDDVYHAPRLSTEIVEKVCNDTFSDNQLKQMRLESILDISHIDQATDHENICLFKISKT